MTPWEIHPAALIEHDEAIIYYKGIEPELAIAFESHYLRYRKLICTNPELFSIRRGMVRRANLSPRFGEYYIAYMLWHEKVVILAVAHAKRRPFYWRKRIGESKKMF